jgi:hypothetical protein
MSVCYNTHEITTNIGKVVCPVVVSAEVLWRIFEKTGSIFVYMLYKRLILQ